MNQWDTARRFYKRVGPSIAAADSNDWGIDSYAWDGAGIRLTPIESWLWHDIRAVDVVLYPQFPIGKYITDFANPVAKVAIECDGAEFHQDGEKDARRDADMQAMGWTVYRISGKDCRDGAGKDSSVGSAARVFIERIAKKHLIRFAD